MSALPDKDWELFRIAEDYTEINNLAAQFPERVAEMDKVWKEWAIKVGIELE
jgi:arylsulfatase